MNTRILVRIRRSLAVVGILSILSTLVISIPVASAAIDASKAPYGKEQLQTALDAGWVSADQSQDVLAKPVNRAAYCLSTVKAFGADEEVDAADLGDIEDMYTDVKWDAWYGDAVKVCVYLGWMVGNKAGKTWNPDGTMSRQELATSSYAQAGKPEVDDADVEAIKKLPGGDKLSSWAVNGAAWAKANSLMFAERVDPLAATIKLDQVVVSANFVAFTEDEELDVVGDALAAVEAGDEDAEDEEEDAEDAEDEEEEDDTTSPADDGTTPPPPPAAPAGALTVALSASNPAANFLADGTAFNPVLKVKFTAGSDGDVKVTKLKVTRDGLAADTAIKLSAFDEMGKQHGGVIQVSADHNAEIGMENDPIVVVKGASTEVTIKANIISTANSGTLTLSLKAADDVMSNSSSATGGTFPIIGNNFQILDGANSVAAATVDVRTLSGANRSVDIGQSAYELTKFEVVETSSKEDLYFKSIKIFNNGSTGDGDLSNLVLKDQTGVELGKVAKTTSKYAEFKFTTPYVIGLGTTKVFTLGVNITSGATRTAQFIIQNDFDIELVGVSTGASILAVAKVGGTDTSFPIGDTALLNQITVNEGSLSVSKDNASPSGDVTKGASDAVLGTFKLQALGEDIELQRVAIDLANGTTRITTSDTTGYMDCTTGASPVVCDMIGSVKLVSEDGKTLITQTAATPALWNNAPAYSDLSSYYTIKAGESKTVKLIGNLSSATTLGNGENVTAGIKSLYYYKKSSLKYADSTTNGVTGTTVVANALTVTTSSLTVSNNTGYTNRTIVDGTSNAKIASFVVKAGSAEGVSITSITLSLNQSTPATGAATNITNLRLMKEDGATPPVEVQLGTTQSSVLDSTATTFSMSNFKLAKSEQSIINLYGDLGSALGADTIITTISAAGVSGSAELSTTATTGPTTALVLQTITGVAAGTLRVTLATDTPLEDQLVSGSTNNPTLKVKFEANQAEDVYLKEVLVRVDADADDASIATLSLFNASATPEVNLGNLSWQQDDVGVPGFVTWTFSGASRPKVPSSGALYLTVKMNTTSSSSLVANSNNTPVLSLASVKAEGIGQISPLFIATGTSVASSGTPSILASDIDPVVPNAVNDTACDVNDAAGMTTTSTTVTIDNGGTGNCNTSVVLGNVGYTIPPGVMIRIQAEQMFVTASTATSLTVVRAQNGTTAATHVDNSVIGYGRPIADATNNVIAAYAAGGASFVANATNFVQGQVLDLDTEDLYVKQIVITAPTVNAGLIYVDRGVNNTTVAAHNTNVLAVNEYTAVTGNAMRTVHTKPTISAHVNSPSGAQSSGANKELARFTVTAAANTGDPAENSVILSQFDLRLSRTGVNYSSLNLYPLDVDQNATFAVASSFFLSQNTARFNLAGNAALVAAGYNKVIEGLSKSFVLRGNIDSTSQGGTLLVEFSNLGNSSSTTLGAGDAGGDMEWTDGTNSFFWVKQGTATNVGLNATALTYGSASGTPDTARPTVSTVVMADRTVTANANVLTAGCTTAATTALDQCDKITITFSEAIDPTSINASLVPGTNATGTTAATNPVVGVLAADTGGIVTVSDGAGGADTLAVTGILGAFNYGTDLTAATTVTSVNLSLNAAGTVLQIFVNAKVNGTAATAASISASTPVGTVLKDVNSNFLNTTGVTATGGF